MIDLFGEMATYPFIVRAVVVGFFVSLCASLLGVSLVLKRYSMIGEGLSNVGFGALSVALAFNVAPLKVSVPVVVLAAFLLLKINENSKIKGDSAIAIISTASLAGGVLLVSKTTGMSLDVCNFMFGSILAMKKSDVSLSIALSILVLLLFVIFYNRIFSVTFDEPFAKATGTKTSFYNMLIAILTAITIVLGMRLMGALLISSLIIFPALSSMLVFKRFQSVVISSAIISALCFLAGLVLSYRFETPTGATVVMANLVVFALLFAIGKLKTASKYTKVASLTLLSLLLLAGCGSEKTNAQKYPIPPQVESPTKEESKKESSKPSESKKDTTAPPKEEKKEQPPTQKDEKSPKETPSKESQTTKPSESSSDPSAVPKGHIPKDASAPKPQKKNGEELVITEKFFITQINDIFYNIDDYKGKTIVVEGMFSMFPNSNGELVIPTVYRLGPGCCGNDGWGGFMLHYDGELPEAGEWIEVKGTPSIQEEDLFINLYLDVTSFKIKKERGSEYVEN